MRIIAFLLATAVCLTAGASGQSTMNVAGQNELTLNAVGTGLSSPITVTFTIGVGIQAAWNALPNSVVLLAADSVAAPGTVVLGPNNVLDLPGGPSFQIVLDGTGAFVPSWYSQFLRTDATGAMALNFPNAPLAPGQNFALQSALVNVAYPLGLQLTAAFNVRGPTPPNLGAASPTCSPGGQSLQLIDDGSQTVNLGFNFTFYGTTYTSLQVISNGSVCFGTPDTSFIESVGQFLSGPPRIAQCWDDLNPANGGTVTFSTDNASTWEVCFSNVPEFSSTGANSFKVTGLAVSGAQFVTMDWAASMTLNDCLIGLSAGNGAAPGFPIDVGTAPNTFTSIVSPYEIFDGINTLFDLKGFQAMWALDASGNPLLQT